MAPNNEMISHQDIATSDIRGITDSSHESTSIPAGSYESFSIFGDSACGEPISPQHLVLDFTPIEDVDNDFVQRKCCAFWDFLNDRTDLHDLMVLPEQKKTYDLSRTSDNSIKQNQDKIKTSTEVLLSNKAKTAVSMLEFVEEKGLIDRTFEAKLPQSMCSLGSREYHENEVTAGLKPVSRKREVCKYISVCKSCRNRQPAGSLPESSAEVQIMCGKMTQWDRQHPKCMDPPGHPPTLSHSIMQRKVVT